jgi:PAS domain S-box-containing protein
MDINDAGLKLLGLESMEDALTSNVEQFYVDLSERAILLEELYGKGHVDGKQVKFRNRAGEVIEVAVTARAKVDESGQLLYHEGIIHNITKALEDERNRVLRNAAGSMCHYLNTHLMHLLNSKEGLREFMASLDAHVDGLSNIEESRETSFRIRSVLEDMRYFFRGIDNAYERISEVTKAFNKAFHYREESYVSDTILDIFQGCGYSDDEPDKC